MHTLNTFEDLCNLIDMAILEGRPLNEEIKQDILYFILEQKYGRANFENVDKMNDPLWLVLKRLPSDYKDYGGEIVRWEKPDESYPDCSSGCIHWQAIDSDWGVCVNPSSPRAGLLTWEHQAGYNCGFETKVLNGKV